MQLADQEAQRFHHDYVGTEHVLLGLLKDGGGVAIHALRKLGVDLRTIRLEVERLAGAGPDTVMLGEPPPRAPAKQVIEYSIEEAQSLNDEYVGTEHVLLGVLREPDGVAARALTNLGLSLEDVRRQILAMLGHTTEQPESPGPSRSVRRPGRLTHREIARLVVTAETMERKEVASSVQATLTELPWSLAISAVVGFVARSWMVFVIVFVVALAMMTLRSVVRGFRR